MALLRDYHAAIGEIIIKYSGTLERYAGDGSMVDLQRSSAGAGSGTTGCKDGVWICAHDRSLDRELAQAGSRSRFWYRYCARIATLGTIGFEGRFDYAAIGTVSNVASRLCDEAKPGQILISPRVLMAVEKDVTVEPCRRVCS